MPTALDAAQYILASSGPMTAMKLQKLLYYSQAWHMVVQESQLFEDAVEAWAAGPVVRSVYERHRGRFNLPADFDCGGDAGALTDEQRRIVDAVIAHYGKWTAEQLSDLTHSEPPWLSARKGLSAHERGRAVIDPLVMADYYTSLRQG